MTEKVLRVKYAAELNMLDLDPKYVFKYIKEYRYGGKDREKAMRLPAPYKVVQTHGKNQTTDVRVHYRGLSGYAYIENIKYDTEVAILEVE